MVTCVGHGRSLQLLRSIETGYCGYLFFYVNLKEAFLCPIRHKKTVPVHAV